MNDGGLSLEGGEGGGRVQECMMEVLVWREGKGEAVYKNE